MAMLAAFSPEVIATLVALAQATKPADSNPTTAEASGKAKRKPAGAAGAAEPQAVESRKSEQPIEDRSQKIAARPRQIKKECSDRAAAKSRQIKEELSERLSCQGPNFVRLSCQGPNFIRVD